MRTKFRTEDTLKILDIDGVYNTQNQRVWVVNHAQTDGKGAIRQERKFPQSGGLAKSLFWRCIAFTDFQ